MSADYEREKLGNAVGALAGSAAPIQDRLGYAFTAMHTLRAHGLSNPDRQAEYDEIWDLLTADKSDPQTGHAPKTIAGLNNSDAEAIARKIVDLNAMLQFDAIDALRDEVSALNKRGA